ncbi:MAG: T9SS C-terminal target domain-containing protein, partial [Bacteroidetes bacterium]
VHVFWERNDSLDARGYLGPPVSDHYKVCLTTVYEDNCKSTYCDFVYIGGIIDTLYPRPCPYYIALTTSNILGGSFCNGTASAGLVDAGGNPVETGEFYWSTGETGPTATNLCVNVPYYVSITGIDGCQVVGSFAIIDYTLPMDPFGYWTVYGFGSSYELNYSPPDSGYSCTWEFSDGTVLSGSNVKYDPAGMGSETVTLTVLDGSGNQVYMVDINLNESTGLPEKDVPAISLYPNPATDVIHLQLGTSVYRDIRVEVYNSLGQRMITEKFSGNHSSQEILLPVSALDHGIYFVRLTGSGNNPVTLSFVK